MVTAASIASAFKLLSSWLVVNYNKAVCQTNMMFIIVKADGHYLSGTINLEARKCYYKWSLYSCYARLCCSRGLTMVPRQNYFIPSDFVSLNSSRRFMQNFLLIFYFHRLLVPLASPPCQI